MMVILQPMSIMLFLNYLQEQRYSAAPTRGNVKRQRLTVEPGRSVTANNDSSSDSDVHEFVTNDNSNDEHPFDLQEVVRQESEYSYFIPRFENIEVGNFILARVLEGSRKKTVYRYIVVVEGVISEQGKQELELLGMKFSDKSRKLFAPQQDDQFLAATEDVIAILPTPSVIDEHGKINSKRKLMSSKCNNICLYENNGNYRWCYQLGQQKETTKKTGEKAKVRACLKVVYVVLCSFKTFHRYSKLIQI
nr:unnamed protein product [Callosobruchus analis]